MKRDYWWRTQPRKVVKLQEAGLLERRHLRTVSMAWLARSVWPLLCGWKPDDRLTVVPISVQDAFQNLAENCGPLSIMVRIVVLWLEVGKPVTKSSAMWDHGLWGIVSGSSNPCGGLCVTLDWAQTEQAATKFWISSLISGHLNLHWMKEFVLLEPGWPESWEEWPHWMTWARSSLGTNSLLSGHLVGVAPVPSASLTTLSMSI